MPEFFRKLFKIWNRSHRHFWMFLAMKNLIVFVPKKCKNGLSVPLKSSIQVSRVPRTNTTLQSTILELLDPLKQVKSA